MRILNVQRMSTEDGPGLRTTVFFKGCTLRCAWCHNPESIPFAASREWIAEHCLRCGACVAACPEGALACSGDRIVAVAGRCRDRFACVDVCPGGAMRRLGEERNPDELVATLVRDRAFYGRDGGVTLSGGEALAQAEAASTLARHLREAGIGVAVDTAGNVPWQAIEAVLPHADLFLYDLKIDDEAAHERWCGAGNELLKRNLERLAAAGARLWIRTPMIPEATADADNVRAIARYLKTKAIPFERWELLAFNRLAAAKYRRQGVAWPFAETPSMSRREMDRLTAVAKEVLGEDAPVRWTGSVRPEEEEHA